MYHSCPRLGVELGDNLKPPYITYAREWLFESYTKLVYFSYELAVHVRYALSLRAARLASTPPTYNSYIQLWISFELSVISFLTRLRAVSRRAPVLGVVARGAGVALTNISLVSATPHLL